MSCFVPPCMRWSPEVEGCHLYADTEDELHEFAKKLGLTRKSLNVKSKTCRYWLHSIELYKHAIELGAVPIEHSELFRKVMGMKEDRFESRKDEKGIYDD